MGRDLRMGAMPLWGLLFVLLSGCTGAPGQVRVEPGPGDWPVVIALIDSGVNPYHVAFREGASSRSGWAPAPEGVRVVNLSLDQPWNEAFAQDAAVWSGLETLALYAFSGTNLLAISFYPPASDEVTIYDDSGHGTGVASVVDLPTVLIVMVETGGVCSTSGEPCVTDPSFARGMEWAATQPWIDIISMSAGLPLNAPDPTIEELARASRAAVAAGKIVLNAAGNTPTASYFEPFAGPPWVLSVGGAVNSTRGDAALAARTPDVVSDFVVRTATTDSVDSYETMVGTSASAPRVAAVLAKAVVDVRKAWNHREGIVDGALAIGPNGERLTNGDLRRALNASARYWTATDWNPTNRPANTTTENTLATSTPIGPAPYVQMGWGFVDEETAAEIVRRVLANDLEPSPEKSEAAAYMQETYAAREAYWRQGP